MAMKNRLHIFYFVFCLSFICALCSSNESRIHSSAQGRSYSSNQHQQNFIKRYNKTKTIFTQKRHHTPNLPKSGNSKSLAKSKFLSLFTVVQFANEECTVGSDMGFCVTSAECSKFGGSKLDSCANGYGTCCNKKIKCGESSSMNVTYIQNADYPSTTSSGGSCTHTITRQDNVCNLRLDFVDFELYDPTATTVVANTAMNGKCEYDQMTVSGVQHSQITYLCGKMPPAWHFYLDVRDASNPTTIKFELSSGVTKARKWNIKVTQIDCERKIPQGCGQYFTGTSGDPLYSFNWGNNGMYLYGMNYAICFRQEKGYCTHSFVDSGPSWVVCPDSLAFPSADIGTNNLIPPTSNGADTRDCTFAAVATAWPIPINTNNYSPTYIYHFTNQDNTIRTAPASPFIPTDISPGFYFTWTHNKC